MAYDDVIEDFDTENPAGFHEPFCYATVGIGRLRVAAGVVMHEHDAMRRADDRRPEHLARMGHRLGQ